MNIISKLTLRHLVENKRRTVVTVLGIATSTALITAILVGIFSFFKFFGYISVQGEGNCHVSFENCTKQQIEQLKNDDRIDMAGVINGEVEGLGVLMDTDVDLRYRVGNVIHADNEALQEYVVSEYEGKLPENSNEIAVEEQFLKDNELDLKVGDTLKYEQGNRFSIDEKGEKIYWGGNYRSEESFEKLSDAECTITAILHGNRPTKSYDILRGTDDSYFEKNFVRVTLKKCDHTALTQIHKIVSDYDLKKVVINSEYMLSVFAFEGSDGTMKGFFTMMAVALAIVIATSVVLIYNAFGMSLAERMRYLGMLASVGATGGQKRGSIYFEGFILGLIGIPLGILIGLIGTDITLHVLGTKLLESDMFTSVEGLRGSVPLVISPLVILAVVFFAALTIFISSVVPAVKASKVMPIDALRQSDTIRVKGRKLRINPLIKRIFGYEGELAYKNIKRNGIKSTVIMVTIAMSVIMFLTINYFCDAFNRSNYYDYNFPFEIIATCAYNERNQFKGMLENIDGVDEVVAGDFISYIFKATETMPEEANKDILNPDFFTDSYKELAGNLTAMQVVTIEDEAFLELLEKNGLSKDDYYGDELKGVLLNNFFHDNSSRKIFNDGIIGQKLFYDNPENNPPAVEIGAFVPFDKDFFAFNMTARGSVSVYVPYSKFYEKAALNIPGDKLSISYMVKTEKHEEVFKKIEEFIDAEGFSNTYCSDMSSALDTMNTVSLMLKTAMYGFTILLTLIAMANIVNTISTGVLLRRKEFAMYKSVGMTGKGFKKMIFLETLLYGIRALVLGIPVSILLSFMMYKALESNLYSFDINYIMYLIVIVAVFTVVGFSMLLSINKIKDDNIIETLKEDLI